MMNVRQEGRRSIMMKVMMGLKGVHELRTEQRYAMNARIPLPRRVLGADEQRKRLEAIMSRIGRRDHGRQLHVIPILDVCRSDLDVRCISCKLKIDTGLG